MFVNVAILKERRPHESRVALVPSVAPKLIELGARLHMERGAGNAIGMDDSEFPDVTFADDAAHMVRQADLVLAVQPPRLEIARAMKPGSVLVCFLYPEGQSDLIGCLLDRRITSFAMERIPRISRAQAMDALSSQSALAGYYAVQRGTTEMRRVLPKLTTAAGVVGPATVLVMGLGVAGLEAIATAHRLGAVVEGYDVRPETEEQARSLGASFVKTGIKAAGKGGYARMLTREENDEVASVLTRHIQGADLVITTASVPGKPAPRLISASQCAGMKRGAVIVDLSADGGGNCEATIPGETTRIGHVTIVAPLNVPSLIGEDASLLYAGNVANLLGLMLKSNVLSMDWDDEILAATVFTHDGRRRSESSETEAFPSNAADKRALRHLAGSV